jgi:uncharacterized membrane protein YwaF
MSHFNTGIQITPFSVAHIVYIVLIFGGVAAGYLWARNKSPEVKEKLLRFLAYALVFSYLSDFFAHEFVYGGLKTDKLPFHLCTVLCPLMAIAQFNRKGHKIAEPVAILCILGPLMYLCYPASVGTGEPWCYQAVQTMFYHGVQLAWGALTIALGATKVHIRRSWKCAVLLVCITLWAKFGNILMEHNWFFLEEDALYIGLVEGGILPKWSLMIINPIVFYLAVLFIYGIIHTAGAIANKKAATKQPVTV